MGISTAISPGTIAGGVGIKTTNTRFGGAVSVLDTRIAVVAQPRVGINPAVKGFSFNLPTTITSPEQAAEIYGFGGPIHLATLRLYDRNQSIGQIPVDIYAIKSASTGKSQGTLTMDVNPTDTDTMTVDAKVYTFLNTLTGADGEIKIGSTLAETQANLVAAFDLSGITGVQYGALMTAHPTVEIAAFITDAAILTAILSGVAGDTIVTTETFTDITNVFDAATLGTTQAGADVTSSGALSFTGTQTITQEYTLKIGSEIIRITLVKGDTATVAATKVKALLDANLGLPVTAGTIAADSIPLDANWEGLTGDEIGIEFEGLTQGLVIQITPMTGGNGTPLITTALDNFQILYTDVISQFSDSGSLDALEIRNEELWLASISRPYLAYIGSSETDATLVSADTDTRLNDRTIVKFPVPGSPSVNIDIAASLVAKVAKTKDADPAVPYYDTVVFGITPGNSTVVQWDLNVRNFIELRGCSTSFVDNGQVKIGDVLTTYHPVGEEFPGFRYAVDIAKLQLILGDLRSNFSGDKWTGKILIGDRDEATNPNARKPSDAKADVFGLIDIWANAAVVKDRDFLKENTFTEIDPSNSNRLNVVVPSILSGAARIRSIDLNFSTEVGGF